MLCPPVPCGPCPGGIVPNPGFNCPPISAAQAGPQAGPQEGPRGSAPINRLMPLLCLLSCSSSSSSSNDANRQHPAYPSDPIPRPFPQNFGRRIPNSPFYSHRPDFNPDRPRQQPNHRPFPGLSPSPDFSLPLDPDISRRGRPPSTRLRNPNPASDATRLQRPIPGTGNGRRNPSSRGPFSLPLAPTSSNPHYPHLSRPGSTSLVLRPINPTTSLTPTSSLTPTTSLTQSPTPDLLTSTAIPDAWNSSQPCNCNREGILNGNYDCAAETGQCRLDHQQ